MILSYPSSFLFVHIEKAAGSSIQQALLPFAQVQPNSRLRRRLAWFGSMNRIGGLYRSLQFGEHATASEVKRCLPPEAYNSLFKFAFVRNPWDRLVSRYAHLLRSKDRKRHGFISGLEKFEDFLKWEMQRSSANQYSYVTDTEGNQIIDFVGHYETLAEDFAKVCVRLKIQAELPHANVSEHRDYRTYYSPETRDFVAKQFRRDIEMFGYDFDGLVQQPNA
jgi:Sulfotransferase family